MIPQWPTDDERGAGVRLEETLTTPVSAEELDVLVAAPQPYEYDATATKWVPVGAQSGDL